MLSVPQLRARVLFRLGRDNFKMVSNSKRQAMYYNVTLRRVRATIAAVEKKFLLHIPSVCLSFGIRHAKPSSYIVMCGLSDSTIISHTAQISGKKAIEHKICGFIFSTTFVRNIPHSKKSRERAYHKCTHMCK